MLNQASEVPVMDKPETVVSKKSILIVDDDQDLRKFLSYLFVKLGYEIHVAGDGEQALNLAREKRPNLLILDLRLPKFPGMEVCRAIREDGDKKFSKTPIIMLTAMKSDVDRVIGRVIGADCYITKPFTTAELLDQVRKLS